MANRPNTAVNNTVGAHARMAKTAWQIPLALLPATRLPQHKKTPFGQKCHSHFHPTLASAR